jgi:hypothetical protein
MSRKMSHTIAAGVRLASDEEKVSNLENRGGSLTATRKNPHVIDAGSRQDLPVSYWFIMWTEISTTQH